MVEEGRRAREAMTASVAPAPICLEREVSPSAVTGREVAGQDAVEVRLVKNEDVIQTLLPDRADEPFHGGVGPGALGGRERFADPHACPSGQV